MKMHFLGFLTCQGCHKVNNLTLSFSSLPGITSFAFSDHFSTRASKKTSQIKVFICWEESVVKRGTKAPPIPVYFVAVLFLTTHHMGTCGICHCYTCPHSQALDLFTLLSLSDSLGTFGLTDKAPAISGQTPSELLPSQGSHTPWVSECHPSPKKGRGKCLKAQ